MRVSDKLALIDKVGRELQSRYRYSEIDLFLAEYGISTPGDPGGFGSKWVYSKAALQGVSDEVLTRIAVELDLVVPGIQVISGAPRNWVGTNSFRLFISHVAKERDKATRLKECMAAYGVSGFVAHEDVHPTLEWQKEIERALATMDAFVAIHTAGFSKSFWTQQEIGFAVGRGVKIISLKMGEDPTGFISVNQALARRGRTAEAIAAEIDSILSNDDRTKGRLIEAKKATGVIKAESDFDEIPF